MKIRDAFFWLYTECTIVLMRHHAWWLMLKGELIKKDNYGIHDMMHILLSTFKIVCVAPILCW